MKRLVSLHLKNWCQHRDLKLKFRDGLNGIFGANGSGKSSVLKAIRFALTGAVDSGDVKEEHVCDRATDKDKAYVTLVFSVSGYEYTVTRGLRGCAAARLERAGHEPVTKVDEVNAVIESTFGKFKQLNSYSFVQQGELFNWLMLRDADRVKWFASLFGVAHCEAIWDSIGRQVLADTRMLPALEDNRDLLRTRIGEFDLRIKNLGEQLNVTEDDLLDEETSKAYEQTIADQIKRTQNKEILVSLKKEHEDIKNRLPAMDANIKRLVGLVESQAAEISRLELLDEAGQKYADQLSSYVAYEKLSASLKLRRAAVEKAIADREPPRSKPEPFSEQDAEQLLEAQARESVIRKTLASAGKSGGKCSSCQQPITAKYLKELKAELDNEVLTARESKLTKQEAVTSYKDWLADWLAAGDRLEREQTQVAELEKSLKKVAKPTAVVADVSKELSMERLLHRTNELGLQKRRKEYDSLSGELASIKKNYSRRLELSTSIEKVSDKELVTIKAALAKSAGSVSLLQMLNTSLAEAHKHKQDMASVLEEKQVAFDRTSDVMRWIELLENKVRPFFHRSGPPKEVSMSYLQNLEVAVNLLLGEFGTPFTVKADESLNFLAKKGRGEFRSARRLSGGEKTVLSLAFWLAVQSIFSEELGVLCLDEPTQHLDKRNIEFLSSSLERLNTVLAGRNLQLLMVTHERGMRHVFSNVIEL